MTDNLSPQNILRRWHAETPRFWKYVRLACGFIGTVGAAVIAVSGAPVWVSATVAGFGAAGMFFSSLTCDDNNAAQPGITNNETPSD